jgi:hypothetical protein
MATKPGKLGQFAGQAAKPASRSKPSAPPSTKGAGKSIGIQGCSLILENDGLKPLKGSGS